MSGKSSIEWTDATWNPVTGCTKVSPGCAHCYAEAFAERFRGVRDHPYEQGFDLKLWPQRLLLPLSWKSSKRIFVNSMSDLFHEDVPESFVQQVFQVMVQARWHIFQVLTKRSDRMLAWTQSNFRSQEAGRLAKALWPSNIWLGVSVESQRYAWRIEHLKRAPAKVKFLSLEPLLGPIDLTPSTLAKIDWVIVGGESGPRARRMDPHWVRLVREQCESCHVPFFFKQWGAFAPSGERVGKGKAGRLLDGTTWDAMPCLQADT